MTAGSSRAGDARRSAERLATEINDLHQAQREHFLGALASAYATPLDSSRPPGTPRHAGVVVPDANRMLERFLQDLQKVVEALREAERVRLVVGRKRDAKPRLIAYRCARAWLEQRGSLPSQRNAEFHTQLREQLESEGINPPADLRRLAAFAASAAKPELNALKRRAGAESLQKLGASIQRKRIR